MPKSNLILANLLHLSYNMWGDWANPKNGPQWQCQPYLRFDEKVWNDLLDAMHKRGMNMVVIDVGDGIEYASHPEQIPDAGGAPGADLGQRVTDWLAGMTDRYCLREYTALTVPRGFDA